MPMPPYRCALELPEPAGLTLWQREKIVIPLPVGVRADIRTSRPVNYTYVTPITIDQRVERVRLFFDRVDHLLPCPSPSTTTGSAKMSDSLIRVITRLLIDACHQDVRHKTPFPARGFF